MPFGTLRRDSLFTPAQVLTEADALNAAVSGLAQVEFDSSDSLSDVDVAAWDAFVTSWRKFYAECNAWDGWIFRAEDSTRDALLDFEDTYSRFKLQLGAAAAPLPDPVAQGARTQDNLSSAADALGNPLQKVGWQLVAGAGIVVVGAVVLLAVARRGGIPL